MRRWDGPRTAIEFLQHRDACMVSERTTHALDSGAGSNQRVARMVTDAFLAAQVHEIIQH